MLEILFNFYPVRRLLTFYRRVQGVTSSKEGSRGHIFKYHLPDFSLKNAHYTSDIQKL